MSEERPDLQNNAYPRLGKGLKVIGKYCFWVLSVTLHQLQFA